MRSVPASHAEGAETQAERIASLIFISSRGGQLIFSTLMVVNDRRRYDRPLVQSAVLTGVWLESGWLSHRLLRARRYDDRLAMWVDTASAAAALLVSQRGLGSGAAAPWTKNVAIGAAIGAGSARRPADAAGAVGALCATAIATGLRARGRDAHVAGLALAVNDAVSWAGTHVATRVYLNAHRRYARLRDEADALTVDRAAAAAAEAERSRQHESLHRITIGVLGRIADSADLASATSVARAEAGRLRYVLRTGGRIPQGLDRALAEIAEHTAGFGLRVELVTAELTGAPPPDATLALRAATERALSAARRFGGASRAVVRAVSAPDSVSVTVRDHGCGFQPGANGDYEAQLLTIRDLLQPHGGTAAIWSEPGGGARVILTVPASQDSVVGAGESCEPGEQGPLQGRREPISTPPATVGPTRFDELPATETRLADRTLLAAVLAWRVTGLVTGAASLIAGGSRYRSRGVAIAQLTVAAAESAWFARRMLHSDRWSDVRSARADAATAAAVLIMGQLNLESADRSTWINWAPWSFAANVVCAQAMGVTRPSQAAFGAAGVIGVNAAQSQRGGDALANSAALAAFFAVSRLFAAQIRGGAVRLERARGEAVREGGRLARARERSAQLRLLHDHALQTLETIASGRFADLAAVRTRARTEATRLERELRSTQPAGRSFLDRLTDTLAEHAEHGLVIDLDCPVAPVADEALIQAFCGAANEALTNVRKHARSVHVGVAVRRTGSRVVVTISDEGIGFDPATVPGGFGMGESIHRRMRDVGGAAQTESSPGTGTRVTLSGPGA